MTPRAGLMEKHSWFTYEMQYNHVYIFHFAIVWAFHLRNRFWWILQSVNMHLNCFHFFFLNSIIMNGNVGVKFEFLQYKIIVMFKLFFHHKTEVLFDCQTLSFCFKLRRLEYDSRRDHRCYGVLSVLECSFRKVASKRNKSDQISHEQDISCINLSSHIFLFVYWWFEKNVIHSLETCRDYSLLALILEVICCIIEETRSKITTLSSSDVFHCSHNLYLLLLLENVS